MSSGSSAEADLVLVGSGLRAMDHLTREAERCLRDARVIFHSAYGRGLVEHLRELNPRARLELQETDEYIVGRYRPEMYRRIADRVLAEVARGPGVVVLHPGSVTVVDAIARRLLAEAAARRLRLRVVPGISSVEFVLAEMGWDLAEGLQVILAQNLVLYRRRLDPTQAAIVIQPGYYDTLWYAGAPLPRPGRFDELWHQLRISYSEEATMALVQAPMAADQSAQVLWFRLGDARQFAPEITPFRTLFIPPASKPMADPGFAARIESWDDLLARLSLDEYGLPRQADPRRGPDETPPGVGRGLREQSRALAAAWPRTRSTLAGGKTP